MKVMAVVKMESFFSMPMPSFLETPLRIQSAGQNELVQIAYKMINVMEHFASYFKEFKASTTKRIDKIECLVWENIIGHDTALEISKADLDTFM